MHMAFSISSSSPICLKAETALPYAPAPISSIGTYVTASEILESFASRRAF